MSARNGRGGGIAGNRGATIASRGMGAPAFGGRHGRPIAGLASPVGGGFGARGGFMGGWNGGGFHGGWGHGWGWDDWGGGGGWSAAFTGLAIGLTLGYPFWAPSYYGSYGYVGGYWAPWYSGGYGYVGGYWDPWYYGGYGYVGGYWDPWSYGGYGYGGGYWAPEYIGYQAAPSYAGWEPNDYGNDYDWRDRRPITGVSRDYAQPAVYQVAAAYDVRANCGGTHYVWDDYVGGYVSRPYVFLC